MSQENCIFCKLAEGKLPIYKIYEDDNVLSFLDTTPFCKGHLLVIPKKHSTWLWDMSPEDYRILTERVKYLANILRKVFDTNWVEEVVAGVGVKHTHIHLLPRKLDDGLGEIPIRPLEPKLTPKELTEIANKILKENKKN